MTARALRARAVMYWWGPVLRSGAPEPDFTPPMHEGRGAKAPRPESVRPWALGPNPWALILGPGPSWALAHKQPSVTAK